jgi:hypothetical protein
MPTEEWEGRDKLSRLVSSPVQVGLGTLDCPAPFPQTWCGPDTGSPERQPPYALGNIIPPQPVNISPAD